MARPPWPITSGATTMRRYGWRASPSACAAITPAPTVSSPPPPAWPVKSKSPRPRYKSFAACIPISRLPGSRTRYRSSTTRTGSTIWKASVAPAWVSVGSRKPIRLDVRSGSRLCENLTDAMIPLLNRGGMMKGFVQGADRQQTTLLPECLDDWVEESNPVRAVDVFVDALELRELGFDGVTPAATGRPGYHPSAMLKLYIYGYLNRVQSSRRLEREAG